MYLNERYCNATGGNEIFDLFLFLELLFKKRNYRKDVRINDFTFKLICNIYIKSNDFYAKKESNKTKTKENEMIPITFNIFLVVIIFLKTITYFGLNFKRYIRKTLNLYYTQIN